MSLRRHRCSPRLELLEGRDTPSNFTVSFSGLTHTLTIVGDSLSNNLTVQGAAGDATKFSLSSTSDTFNHVAGPLNSPSGVLNISITLLDGDDNVTFGNTVPIDVKGNLLIRGNGANSVSATDMKVEKNLTIINGTNTTGTDSNGLANLTVGGSLTINNGVGNTSTTIYRNSAGLSSIAGNVLITNGAGTDYSQILDTNVGGNVTISNGHGGAGGNAGYSKIYNSRNTSSRSVIKGNVAFSYLDGNVDGWDGIWDAEILGNVTINHGSGAATTYLDGYQTSLPVIVRGNLTLTGSGGSQVYGGTGWAHTGLIVGKNLSVTTGGAADTLTFNKLEVDGYTRLALGNGNNVVTIDDSVFVGTFTLSTGTGGDNVFLDHTAGSGGPTTFERPVVISQGAGEDQVVRAGGSDANQELIILGTFVIHHGVGADTMSSSGGHEIFPFGTSIQWVV